MSGHSKWSKVKHQKATTDVVKAAAFTKASHAIMIAVREGGGVTNPDDNFHLRLAIEKARDVNMPKENIERAIAKAKGAEGAVIESITYEGYGPGGVAFLVSAATDSHARTAAAVKNAFERFGGNLASPGAVSFQFQRAGIIIVEKAVSGFDALFEAALSAGASDVIEKQDVFEVYTDWTKLMEVKKKLEEAGIAVQTSELIMKPTITISPPPEKIGAIESLEEHLEELPDVQAVYTNVA